MIRRFLREDDAPGMPTVGLWMCEELEACIEVLVTDPNDLVLATTLEVTACEFCS
jgi:hypothetical protein